MKGSHICGAPDVFGGTDAVDPMLNRLRIKHMARAWKFALKQSYKQKGMLHHLICEWITDPWSIPLTLCSRAHGNEFSKVQQRKCRKFRLAVHCGATASGYRSIETVLHSAASKAWDLRRYGEGFSCVKF